MEETACAREDESTVLLLVKALHRPTGDGAEEATTQTINCVSAVAAKDHPVCRKHT
jgi:hypothetical protein